MKNFESLKKMLHWPIVGHYCFEKTLGWMIPYTGTVKPKIIKLSDGFAQLLLKDRRAVRNHLKSIHAIAMTNIAELAAGLALDSALRAEARWIPTGLDIQYLKKARGDLKVICETDIAANFVGNTEMLVNLINAEGVIVAVSHVRYNVK